MKISLQLIQQYTEITLPLKQLIAKIGAQLGAVEEVTDLRGKYKGIKIVEITEARPHLNADKLSIYQMTTGDATVQVVSGDRSLAVGDKVAWLAPGCTIPHTYGSDEPVVMEVRPLRGEISNGMFGSGKELDLNDDDERVLVLDTDAKPGTLLSEAYQLEDVIIDIENKMFTHRPDCFGLLGVAREIAGIQQIKFTSPDWYLLEAGKFLQAEAEPLPLTIHNEIPALCPTYQAAVMSGVAVGPSPLLLQSYLKRVGIRPINNVVDVTNWLMYLTGQPLHAFDYHKVAAVDHATSAAITVRTPKKSEQITLLNGKIIEPHSEAILICSRHKPIALGGVMGGIETEVDSSTTAIIIESATFNMYSIRKTAFAQGIFTDAVTRFGKGQSSEQCGVVLAEAVGLLRQYSGARLASELGVSAPVPPAAVKTEVAFINNRLGSDFEAAYIADLLSNVELRVTHHGDHLVITPGFWRTDLEIPEDIVEEVGRFHGFANLPHGLPTRSTQAAPQSSLEALKRDIRDTLAAAGNNEVQTYSFIAARLLERAGQDSAGAYRVRNALSPELELVRTSLLPSLLDKVHPNHKAGYDHFGLFEIGKSHNKYDIITDPKSLDDQLPKEHLGLSYVFSAERKAAHQWQGAPFYQAKHELGHMLDTVKFERCTYTPLTEAQLEPWWLQNIAVMFEPKRAALVGIDGVAVGIVGEFTASLRRNFKLPEFVAGFEIDLGLLNGIARPTSTYQPLLRFPAITQDICFKVSTTVTYGELEALIAASVAADQRLRVRIHPVDVYQRPDQPEFKQLTYGITLQHHDKTLTTAAVNGLLDHVAKRAKQEFGAERV